MKTKFTFVFLFVVIIGFSQDQNNKITFTQFDITVPLRGNENRGTVDQNGVKNDNWFIPDGIGSKFGYGVHYNKWISISANTGIDFLAKYKLVTAPVYLNFRLSPKISDEIRIAAQFGLGKSYALGRGNLNGTYQKISLGIETSDGLYLFIQVDNHGYKVSNSIDNAGSVSIGIALVSF